MVGKKCGGKWLVAAGGFFSEKKVPSANGLDFPVMVFGGYPRLNWAKQNSTGCCLPQTQGLCVSLQ